MIRTKKFVSKKLSRKGKVVMGIREHYLRSDVRCGSELCTACPAIKPEDAAGAAASDLGIASRYILPDTNIILHHPDLLEHSTSKHVIVLQVVLDEVRNRSPHTYARLRTLISDPMRNFFVFLNEHHRDTYVTQLSGESPNDRNDRAIRAAAHWYEKHLSLCHTNVEILLISDDSECLRKAAEEGVKGMTAVGYVKEYVSSTHPELLDIVSRTTEIPDSAAHSGSGSSAAISHKVYLSEVAVANGLRNGTLFQGPFHIGRDRNHGVVLASSKQEKKSKDTGDGDGLPESFDVKIEGQNAMNRAVHNDLVVVRLIDDVKKAKLGGDGDGENKSGSDGIVVPDIVDDDGEKEEEEKQEEKIGEVVAIVKRMWRPFVGTIDIAGNQKSIVARDLLVVPMDRRIPKIRIRTRQGDSLKGMRIVVQLDDWSVGSRYPNGHYIRTLGVSGDKAVETNALLIEHEIPTNEFSEAVMACLPKSPWIAENELKKERKESTVSGSGSGSSGDIVVELVDKRGDTMTVTPSSDLSMSAKKGFNQRRDLRDVDICSVDPIGCTDIDDALHVKKLDNGLLEIGVHIADVSYFVRPGAALDAEASRRATTVYLVDKRVEMLPSLLSTQICSLRENEDRYAFSVIWTVNDKGVVQAPTWFGKTIIRNRKAFSYEEAQAQMDDPSYTDKITENLRVMNGIAKHLRARRRAAGTLVLASPEVKFKLEEGGENPVDCETYQLHEANSMVEEYMLFANVTVAERIHKAFSHCAMLRRHAPPRDGPLDTLAMNAKRVLGVDIDTTSSLSLGQSLDAAAAKLKNTMPWADKLLRIMTTRCMSRARYFSSGSIEESQFRHYGLAVPIYTHFTSPIRRYADLVVHRLLAASLGQELHAGAIATHANDDAAGAALSSSTKTYPLFLPTRHDMQTLADAINRRAYAAQLSGRASVELHSVLFFEDRVTPATAHVTRIRDDGVIVLVQQFGVEAKISTKDLPIHVVMKGVDDDDDEDSESDSESEKCTHTWSVIDDGCAIAAYSADSDLIGTVKLFDELNVLISSESDTSSPSNRKKVTVRVAKGTKRKK